VSSESSRDSCVPFFEQEGKPVANMTEEEKLYRPKVVIEEKVVEVERVVEKVKEVRHRCKLTSSPNVTHVLSV